jgi:regulator of protease activity HflC (stomatin/prohibitin superfamily)
VVEVKDVEIPQGMQRSMAGQAQAERERRAKIIAAEGEYQASQRLSQAADRLESPTALQLRLFQTLTEISSENNSTVILPIPIDLFRPYLGTSNGSDGAYGQRQERRREDREAEHRYEVTPTPAEDGVTLGEERTPGEEPPRMGSS